MPEGLEGFAAPRRLAAHEKKIAEITKEDMRVRVFGTVIHNSDNLVVLDDGTGKISVNFRDPVEAKPGMTVRIFGKVMPAEEGFEIEGEILQDMGNVDVSLYKKAVELEKGV